MKPWELLDVQPVPDSDKELKFYKRDTEYSIRVNYTELMNSRVHGSEEALAEITIDKIGKRKKIHILIGGLGMGFTLRAALDALPADATITIGELSPAVVKWNKETLSHLANSPLNDPRVKLVVGDVRKVINDASSKFDAIILDVDNGPEGLTAEENSLLYSRRGLKSSQKALKQGGILSVWSSGPSEVFTDRLKKLKYEVDEQWVRERGKNHGGGKHTLWFAKKRS